MEIIINGQKETVSPCTIAHLVASKGLAPGSLVVECNRQIIKQEEWQKVQLKTGDKVELLSFVGGG